MSYLNYTNFTVIQVISAALNYGFKARRLQFTRFHFDTQQAVNWPLYD